MASSSRAQRALRASLGEASTPTEADAEKRAILSTDEARSPKKMTESERSSHKRSREDITQTRMILPEELKKVQQVFGMDRKYQHCTCDMFLTSFTQIQFCSFFRFIRNGQEDHSRIYNKLFIRCDQETCR